MRARKCWPFFVEFTCGILCVLFGYSQLTEGNPFGLSFRFRDKRSLSDGGSESLFGAMETIEGKTLMLSLLIIVGGVLCLESIFHALHHFTLETPFNDVVIAIEKELMVVGCTAFIFKIVINAQTQLSHEFYFALEFSDLLVPFFSFANCLLSLILIFMSLLQCETWRKSYHLKLEELLDEFIREDGNYFFM